MWPGVALAKGANRAVVTATVNGTAMTDAAAWTGPDAARGLRIEAGDAAGHIVGGRRFGSDRFVTGGKAVVPNMGGLGGRMLALPRPVAAAEPVPCDYRREGDAFAYAMPAPNGRWTATIHSLKPREAEAVRPMMTVAADGRTALPAFSARDAAGGAPQGVARRFPVRVTDGILRLAVSASGGQAVVAAIEVARQGGGSSCHGASPARERSGAAIQPDSAGPDRVATPAMTDRWGAVQNATLTVPNHCRSASGKKL